MRGLTVVLSLVCLDVPVPMTFFLQENFTSLQSWLNRWWKLLPTLQNFLECFQTESGARDWLWRNRKGSILWTHSRSHAQGWGLVWYARMELNFGVQLSGRCYFATATAGRASTSLSWSRRHSRHWHRLTTSFVSSLAFPLYITVDFSNHELLRVLMPHFHWFYSFIFPLLCGGIKNKPCTTQSLSNTFAALSNEVIWDFKSMCISWSHWTNYCTLFNLFCEVFHTVQQGSWIGQTCLVFLMSQVFLSSNDSLNLCSWVANWLIVQSFEIDLRYPGRETLELSTSSSSSPSGRRHEQSCQTLCRFAIVLQQVLFSRFSIMMIIT